MSERGLAIFFALATACFWGVYGPTLGFARTPVKIADGGWSAFKPYVFIGVAYLVWGCLGGILAMKYFGDSFSFGGAHKPAAVWGFIAGSLGAFGALTLTFAMMNAKGNAGLVMPIVFGGAVSVTAITTLILLKGQAHAAPSPMLWVGMLLVVIGIVLVAKNSPHAPPGAKPPAKATAATAAPPADTVVKH
jgi:drug/metabolite transporter (DMT)-like permease